MLSFHITISSSKYECWKTAFFSNSPKYLVRTRMIEYTEEINYRLQFLFYPQRYNAVSILRAAVEQVAKTRF